MQLKKKKKHGSFTPLVLSATGGMGTAASICYTLKRIAAKLSEKSNTPYTMTMAWLRINISFSLLRSAIQCIRGSRSGDGRPQTEIISQGSPLGSEFSGNSVEAGLSIQLN